MTRKRERVPEVLWRLFRSRARTLADTILTLIPPSPQENGAECRCKGVRCLLCSGKETMTFLVRPGDPSDYRKLLTGCFVVVSENAPPVPLTFDPHCRWSQREIVRRSIEIIMHEQPSSSNLICCSYDKENRSSAVVDTLTSSDWSILLRRVGDALMMYLLKYTSIFLPLPRKKFHQISGFPISDLSCRISRRMADSNSRIVSDVYDGSRKKRKMDEGIESIPGKELYTCSSGTEPSSKPVSFVASNGSCCFSHNKCDVNVNDDNVSSKKRTRQYSWQRQRKRRKLIVQEQQSWIHRAGNSCTSDKLSGGLMNCISTSSCQNHEDARMVGQVLSENISKCICCSVFEDEPKMNLNAEIDRQNIFFKFENSTSILPRKHILYTVKPNNSGASVLFNSIFRPFVIDKNSGTTQCLHTENNSRVMYTCLYHSLTKLLKSLIRETQNCRYLRLLDKHCPIGSSYQEASTTTDTGFKECDSDPYRVSNTEKNSKTSQISIDQVEPNKCYCPKTHVVSFIWAICRRIVPSPLLGESSNWRVLRKNISNFIRLRRFEKFSLKECVHKLKISKFPLFSNNHVISDIGRHAILQCWMRWFFSCLVSPLIEANFYVTESEHEKQEVLYFRKSTWKKLTIGAEWVKDGRYCQLDHPSAVKIIGNRSFGFSKARLRPKQFGFRMLTNLQAPSRMRVNHRVKYRFFKSVNSVLQDLHVVLKSLRNKEPEKLGSSVFDYNDVYRKLVPFLYLVKNGSTETPDVFVVVSDVSKAFDSVNQEKLISVMEDVILEDVYSLEKFTQVICTRKFLKVHQHTTLANQNIFDASSKIPRLPAQTLDCVLIKKELRRNITKDEIISILKEHITRNVVRLHNNFYLQSVGIPQGSVLSSLLCSFYYGHMDTNVIFPFLEKATFRESDTSENIVGGVPSYLLLRFIDDFLFISTSKKQASMFFSRLERGVRDYNCCMNEEKYGLNFNMSNGQEFASNTRHVGGDGVSYLRWSGLLVNCSTLEIQADYARYLNSHLSSTLTVSCRGKVGRHLTAKLRCYLRPKCHPIFYDSNINSPGVVRLNIYQVFLLCAMKFICYIRNLSTLPRFSPKFYFNAIDTSLRYMNRLVKRRMYSFEVDAAFRPKYDVKKKDIVWLGLYAYIRVLKKKQSGYIELLGLLRSKLKAYGKVKNVSSELKYAIDDAHSSVLWSIKY